MTTRVIDKRAATSLAVQSARTSTKLEARSVPAGYVRSVQTEKLLAQLLRTK